MIIPDEMVSNEELNVLIATLIDTIARQENIHPESVTVEYLRLQFAWRLNRARRQEGRHASHKEKGHKLKTLTQQDSDTAFRYIQERLANL